MVSKASEDLPEPDNPVNTTSLSRGISTSTFLRLCSRAPRMVIARVPELCWRLALITSSVSAYPGAEDAPRFQAKWDPFRVKKTRQKVALAAAGSSGAKTQTKRPARGRPFPNSDPPAQA